MDGIIIIDKEPGYTSADVVARLRGILKQKKIGHTGTLDPMATGVLPVCLGKGTRLCDMLTDSDKEYVADMLLGTVTDTQDITGAVLSCGPVEAGEDRVRRVIMEFVGEYDQIPPMYSAVKINGKRLYELARAGQEVERKARRVRIQKLEILEMALPRVKMRVACSKGTYIRTLCSDIGERLGCGGTMEGLRRTRAAGYCLRDALTLGQVEELARKGEVLSAVMPVESVFAEQEALHVREEYTVLVDNGNPLLPGQTEENKLYPEGMWVRIYRKDGSFCGIYSWNEGKRRYIPVKMFV